MSQKQTRVLAVDDDNETTEWLRKLFESRGYEVRTANDARTSELLCELWHPDVVLLDLVMPDVEGVNLLRRLKTHVPSRPVVIVSGAATVPTTVEAFAAGAATLIEKPVMPDKLVQIVEQLTRGDHEEDAAFDDGEIDELGAMQTRSPAMRRLFQTVRKVAPTDVNVLVVGENGTGKELVAAAIHDLSDRCGATLVKVNCAAIPADLLESELFGHSRGAFTDAAGERKGLFEMAHRGSIFLDEIAEMPPRLQAKLLRVLQEHEFRPVGSTQTVRTDFRLICATNADPDEAVREGKLREDLYFRLNTILLTVPPLRERPEDLPLLATQFVRVYSAQYDRKVQGVGPAAMRALEQHDWPGNVRELEHAIERAVILSRDIEIKPTDLPEFGRARELKVRTSGIPRGCTLEEIERLTILQTLELTGWNKRATADILGIHRPTLYNKLRKYRLWRSEDRFRHGNSDETRSGKRD
jgi:two-component system, NtrC family, response regulator HydG